MSRVYERIRHEMIIPRTAGELLQVKRDREAYPALTFESPDFALDSLEQDGLDWEPFSGAASRALVGEVWD